MPALPIADRLLREAAARSEQNYLESLIGRLQRLEGNPFDVHTRRFGGALAITMRQASGAAPFNRILHLSRSDVRHLPEVSVYFNNRVVAWQAELMPEQITPVIKREMERHRLRLTPPRRSIFVASLPLTIPPYTSGISIHPVAAREIPLFTEIYRRGFERAFDGGKRTATVVAHALTHLHDHPDWRLYIAWLRREPAGVAVLHLDGSRASLASAATLPALRRRGVQTALLYQRIQDAQEHGCNLIVAQTTQGSRSAANLQRAGLRSVYTTEVWRVPWYRIAWARMRVRLVPVPSSADGYACHEY